MTKLRLLKVIVQPVFVVDDGETLTEQATDPVVVTAKEWPDYAKTGFLAAAEGLEQQLIHGARPENANRSVSDSAEDPQEARLD